MPRAAAAALLVLSALSPVGGFVSLSEQAKLSEVFGSFLLAYTEKDVEGTLEYYADDALLIDFDTVSKTVTHHRGKAGVKEVLELTFFDRFGDFNPATDEWGFEALPQVQVDPVKSAFSVWTVAKKPDRYMVFNTVFDGDYKISYQTQTY